MLVIDSARWIVGLIGGLFLGFACGPEPTQQCYSRATLPGYDVETGVLRTCDVEHPIPRKHPEFEDTAHVLVTIPKDGNCPMCPWELDEIFWQAFLDELEDRGLEDGEDPDCVNQGYAIEIACLTMAQQPDTCTYSAIVASHCTLGPNYTPVRPSP